MPDKSTIEKAKKDKAEGKSASTQAGEFVREEMDHIRDGKHGARSTKQAIAIGLSKARRAGVKLPSPNPGTQSEDTIKQAARDTARGRSTTKKVSAKRSRAVTNALKREGHSAASKPALSKHAKASARKRGPGNRKAAARKAVVTKGRTGLKRAAAKAARTRASR